MSRSWGNSSSLMQSPWKLLFLLNSNKSFTVIFHLFWYIDIWIVLLMYNFQEKLWQKNQISTGRVMETNADHRCTLLLSETYAATVVLSKSCFTKVLSNHKTLFKLTCAVTSSNICRRSKFTADCQTKVRSSAQ